MSISDAQKRAVAKYNSAHYDRVELRLSKGLKPEIALFAKEHGYPSINSFINQLLMREIQKSEGEVE